MSRSSKSQNLLSKPVEKTSKSSVKTRSKRKSTTKFPEFLITTKKRKTQPATRQVRRRGSVSLATSSSRNKFVFGKDCVVCDKFELRYKNKDRDEIGKYLLLLTLDAPAKAIVKMLKKKEMYKESRENTILVTDLISAEFKSHDKCRKELTRDDRNTSIVERPADGFKKVTDYVDNYFLKMNQVVSMNIVYRICYGTFNI